MAAKAPKGTMLHLRAKGEGAAEAVGALVELVERDFDEGADHAEPLRLQGHFGLGRLCRGPAVRPRPAARALCRQGDRRRARSAALEAAIASARRSGSPTLIETADGEAADILEFQLAMLEDDALTGPAFAAIAPGTPADAAWRQALDAEIAGYETSDEDYFRARAADHAATSATGCCAR